MTKIAHAVILDDHQLFADAFSLILERYNLFDQIHTFSTTRYFTDVLLMLGRKEVYIFLDYYLKEETGLSLLPEIKRLNKNARIIFVTGANSPSVIQNILLSKPHGILSKCCDLTSLINCIGHINSQETFLDIHIQKLLHDCQEKASSFTPRELELLRYFAAGLSIAETAAKISLSQHTIIAHRRKMMARVNCHSIGQLVRYAQDHELI